MYTPPTISDDTKPLTLTDFVRMKAEGENIACLTAYDASFGALVDRAGVDFVLVGDSLGMVIQGHDTTVPVTIDDMIYHTNCVSRALRRGFLVADMPFLSFATNEHALASAAGLLQEGGAKMVKLEGGAEQADVVEYLAIRGISICAHLGLTPQHVHKLGGFRVQGKSDSEADRMVAEAKILESAGADIVLLECVPSALAARVTEELTVPVIGIGAGPDVSGQILVLYDILGVSPGRKPRFAHNFLAGRSNIEEAVTAYVAAVKDGSYPADEHCY